MSKSATDMPYAVEAQQAAAAAERAGLGRPGRAFANTKLGFGWKQKDTGQLVYEFDGGLVSQQVGGPAEVFPWSRIVQVTRIGRHENKNGRYVCTQFAYKVTRDDGAVMELKSSYVSPEKNDRADPDSAGARMNEFGDDVTRRVSAARLPAARAALDRGEILTFGLIRFSAEGIVFKKGVVGWSLIQGLTMRDGNLAIHQVDKKLSLATVPVSSVPNLPLMITLVGELRAKAR